MKRTIRKCLISVSALCFNIKVLLIFSFVLIQFTGFSQKNIDFNHKKIKKFISKTYDIEAYKLNEISIENNQYLKGKFFRVESNGNFPYIVYIGRVNSCRAGGCSIDNNLVSDVYEYFDYVITFDENNMIKNLKVYNYQATHGQEITSKSWLKQFRYKENFVVNKNIDAISGATISVYAITDDVNKINNYLKRVILKQNKSDKFESSMLIR